MKGDAKWERGDNCEGKGDGPASEGCCEGCRRGDREKPESDDPGRIVAQVDNLMGMPLVTENQDREKD
jgi:hypothetical protein